MDKKLDDKTTLGRYWGSAATAKLFEHSEGDASIRFEWADGAAMTISYESHEEARKALARLGFLRAMMGLVY